MDNERDDLIRQLQAELLSLKANIPQLKLRKTPPSESSSAPFPIHATASIQAPEDASHIDADIVQLQATITASTGAATEPQSLIVALKILNTDLPQLLKDAIVTELNRIRIDASYASSSACDDEEKTLLHLDVAFKELAVQYSRLLCMLPQCIERYEGVDASGRTIRRVAILNENLEVRFEASVPIAMKKVAPTSDGLPRALQAELDSLKLKYTLEMHDAIRSSSKEVQDDVETSLHHLSLENKSQSPQSLSFSVSMVPTDPEWAPAGCPLHLKCCILDTARFPAVGTFSVVLDQQLLLSTPRDGPALTHQETAVFNKLLEIEAASVAGRPGALRALLRQCENRVGEIVHQAGDMAVEIERRRRRRRKVNNVAGSCSGDGEKRSGGKRTARVVDETSSDSCENDDEDQGDSYDESSRSSHEEEESDTDSFSSSSSSVSSQEEEADIKGAPQSQSEGVLVHNSLRLTLESLNLVDIDTLDILKLNLQLSCLRCLSSIDASIVQDSSDNSNTSRRHLVWQGECGTCRAHLQLTVAPRIVHDGSNTLAVVRGDGCAPVDVLPSMLAAQCTHCSSLAAFRSAQIGKWNERLCGQCHQRMQFFVESVAFSAVSSTNDGLASDQRRSRNRVQNTSSRGGSKNTKSQDARGCIDIVVGQPLPNHGACRHYRHSHRWLRFPCCGRRFPCDLCHEEGTDGHEMMWAQRMVCGFCSTEQTVGERCCSCDKRVATSARRPTGRKTAFWEGGEGQRDVKFLSKRDPHKFSGRTKTKSRKSGRVGTKGKEKTERAAARTGGMY